MGIRIDVFFKRGFSALWAIPKLIFGNGFAIGCAAVLGLGYAEGGVKGKLAGEMGVLRVSRGSERLKVDFSGRELKEILSFIREISGITGDPVKSGILDISGKSDIPITAGALNAPNREVSVFPPKKEKKRASEADKVSVFASGA